MTNGFLLSTTFEQLCDQRAATCRAHFVRYDVAVDVHGRLDVRLTHHFLLHGNGAFPPREAQTVRVPECDFLGEDFNLPPIPPLFMRGVNIA